MNKHWLVLTDHGWEAFSDAPAAVTIHCQNIEQKITSYLVKGTTLDANAGGLKFALTDAS